MKYVRVFWVCLVLFIPLVAIFGQENSIGDIKWEESDYQGKLGLKFMINDVYVYGLKGNTVTFAFRVKQGNKWVKDTLVKVPNVDLPYDDSYFKEACWFFYSYDKLEKSGGKDFLGYFYVVNEATNKSVAVKKIEFTTKTIFDYFRENAARFETHPQSQKYYIDYDIADEWVFVDLEAYKTVLINQYKVLISSFRLNRDGTGLFTKNLWALLKNGTIGKETTLTNEIIWAVEVYYTEDNRPVTLIKTVFVEDKSVLYLYYFLKGGTLTCLVWDHVNQVAGTTPYTMIAKKEWDRQWNKTKKSLEKTLYDFYIAKQQIDQQRLSNMMMTSYMGTQMFNGFSNLMAGNSWSGMPIY
ncbi:MAG: hypothetical protein JW969_01680 [Spirochaetales bacterium]|nr:hypothetical protein [Spirochaetales bacterium]